MNDQYGHRWIGIGAQPPSHVWPARSPDLAPLDFFVWGFVKNVVYRVEIDTIEQLEERIREAIALITPEMLENCRGNLLRRLNCCLAENGGHFEHLMVN